MNAIDLMQFLTDKQAGRVLVEALDSHKEYDGTPMEKSDIVDLALDYFTAYSADEGSFLARLSAGGYGDLADYLQYQRREDAP